MCVSIIQAREYGFHTRKRNYFILRPYKFIIPILCSHSSTSVIILLGIAQNILMTRKRKYIGNNLCTKVRHMRPVCYRLFILTD